MAYSGSGRIRLRVRKKSRRNDFYISALKKNFGYGIMRNRKEKLSQKKRDRTRYGFVLKKRQEVRRNEKICM